MRTIASALVLLLALSPALPQNQPGPQQNGINLDGFLTEGGVVNLVEGEVSYLAQDTPPRTALAKQQLQNGDAIETGQNGRAEILLNPGYYLRLSANTRILFVDLAPNNLDLRIAKGSAIVEISLIYLFYTPSWQSDPSYSDLYDGITVRFPQNQFSLVAGGIYRFDVAPDGVTQLKVPKGRAFFAGNRIENGMSAEYRNGSTTLAKINADQMDAFDLWSRGRAEFLIKTNHTLRKTEWHKAIRDHRLGYLSLQYDDDERARELHTVSALGGYVAFTQPGVLVRNDGAVWTTLRPHAELKFGDTIKTDADGRAQIYVYGTCSLFLASNSEIIYGARPDGDVAIKVLRGSALIYFTYGDEKKAARPVISFATRQMEFEIIRDGIYQLTADNNSAEMNVYFGKVRASGREIKQDKKAVVRDSKLEVQDLSKRARDSFYVWSVKRVSALTRARRVKLNGMWYFDNEANIHTYVPGVRVFRSPYGGEYSVRFAEKRRAEASFF